MWGNHIDQIKLDCSLCQLHLNKDCKTITGWFIDFVLKLDLICHFSIMDCSVSSTFSRQLVVIPKVTFVALMIHWLVRSQLFFLGCRNLCTLGVSQAWVTPLSMGQPRGTHTHTHMPPWTSFGATRAHRDKGAAREVSRVRGWQSRQTIRNIILLRWTQKNIGSPMQMIGSPPKRM